jgi:hypothetical protein
MIENDAERVGCLDCGCDFWDHNSGEAGARGGCGSCGDCEGWR